MAANAARKRVAKELAAEVAQLRSDIAWLATQVQDLQEHASAQPAVLEERVARLEEHVTRPAAKKAAPAAKK
jgi:cell division protein FtsB